MAQTLDAARGLAQPKPSTEVLQTNPSTPSIIMCSHRPIVPPLIRRSFRDRLPRRITAIAVCLLWIWPAADAADWPMWRGPGHDGLAVGDAPTQWSARQNIAWSVDVPGKGHGSPIVVQDRVLLATADLEAQRQELLCFDRATGKLLWRSAAHTSGLIKEGNKKATLASCTPAAVGDLVFINFLNNRAVYTTATRLDTGKQVWQSKICDYKVHQGYGSSPIPFSGLLLVSADNKGGGAIAALDQQTGKIIWQRRRPKKPNYPSPSLVTIRGEPRMIMTGCDKVSCFEPRSGKLLWEADGATTECVTTTVSTGDLIFTSGGYPKNHVAAVAADGSGKVVWENKTRVYVPSMLLHDNHLYAVTDQGFAVCWRADSGEQQWKHRLPGGGAYTASPVMLGNRIYASSERGLMSVFTATPEKFELLEQNQLGDEIYATPVICDGRIYARVVETASGDRQERLYCIGQ